MVLRGLTWLLCGWLLACAQLAYGHAALIGSDPIEGAILDAAPTQVTLNFNEPVGAVEFKLIAPDGHAIQPESAQSINQRILVTVPQSTTHGTYLLSWRVVSADGHPVGGVLSYSLGAVSPVPEARIPSESTARMAAIWAGRWLLYLCLMASVGAALFRAITPSTGRQDWVRRVIPAGLALLFINLALQGLDVLDAPWRALVQADTWRAALATTYAGTLGFEALALAAAWRALDSPRPWAIRAAAAAGAVLLGVAVANSGHVGTATPQWLSRPAVALHIIAAAAWLGALIPLIRLLSSSAATLPRALSRFSRWIMPVVGLIVVSGITMACLQLSTPSDLWLTPYGRILAVKLVLLCVLFLMAAVNRYRYTQAAVSGQTSAQRGLRSMIFGELALVVCILAVVSLWRFTPPPRSLHAHPTVGAHASASVSGGHDMASMAALSSMVVTHLSNQRVRATLIYQPGEDLAPGQMAITLSGPDDQPVQAQAVTVTFSNPDQGIEPLRREALHDDEDIWRVAALPLPNTGGWQARLIILIDDFDQITLDGPVGQ